MAELTFRQKQHRLARIHNQSGHPMQARDVVYQLLNILNDKIGAARAYYEDTYLSGEVPPFEWTPNYCRDQLVTISEGVLERRVDRAVILHPDKRRAANIFRGFVEYASATNWNDREEFNRVLGAYEIISDHVEYVGTTAERVANEIATRRLTLENRTF